MKEFGEYKQMKRNLVVILVALMMCVSMYAHTFEIIWETPFDKKFDYYEEWPDDEGYEAPGITNITCINGEIYIYNEKYNEWEKTTSEGYVETPIKEMGIMKQTEKIKFVKEKNKRLRLYINNDAWETPQYILELEPNVSYKTKASVYYTEGMVFAQTNEDKLISWKLLGNGKSEYYNAKQTQEMLDSGLAEKVGLSTNKTGTNFFFGEFNATSGYGPNFSKIKNNLEIKTSGYDEYDGVSAFNYIATDKTGLSYFWGYKYNGKVVAIRDPDNPIEVLIAVLDPWTKEVNIIELPAGDWDPSRNAGGLIARCSQCIDGDGNVYFTDCNKEKGVYQIKKLTNTWSEELGYSNRIIGRMNSNRIPLYEIKSINSDPNGYNYEHEFLWVLEKNESWCKVRKVDGREGFIETKYIDFN